jgi:hypothetical protein
MVWRIVVLVMAVGMLGHVAQRLFGARWGLSIAGFFAGFASSTAAVSGMGQRARAEPAHTSACAAAALLANLASLLLFVAVVGAVSPACCRRLRGLVGAGLALLGVVALLWRRAQGVQTQAAAATGRAFQLSQALWLALIAGVSLLAAWLGARYGSAGVLAGTMLVALAEVHAAAAGVAQMAANGVVPLEVAHWGVLGAGQQQPGQSALAFASGGARYGVLVTGGLLALVAGGVLGQLWWGSGPAQGRCGISRGRIRGWPLTTLLTTSPPKPGWPGSASASCVPAAWRGLAELRCHTAQARACSVARSCAVAARTVSSSRPLLRSSCTTRAVPSFCCGCRPRTGPPARG